MYYISEISIITKDKQKSVIKLDKGLNIIYGKSNTGKSLIVDCINYMYGAQKHRFDDKLNIKEIQMIVISDGGNLELSREINTKKITVISTIDSIDNGSYGVGSDKNSISKVWLKLMGINDETKIVSTLEGKLQRLTYRTFSHIFLVDEEEVIKTVSILTSKGSRGNVSTSVLSALLYLATGNTYLPKENVKTKEIRNERKDAVNNFVQRSLDKIRNKNFEDFTIKIDKTPVELEKEINIILSEIEDTESLLEINSNKRIDITNEIFELDDKINQNNILYNRNVNLASQYASDIKRLTFIAESDAHMNGVPILDHCPFCNGELPKEQTESCVDAAVQEVKKIEKQFEDLRSLQKSLLVEIDEFTSKKYDLISQRKEIDRLIRNEIKPKINKLKSQLHDYTLSLNQSKTEEMLKDFNDIIISELKITEVEESKELKIEIPKYFEEIFKEKIIKNLKNLLTECKYRNYENCDFEIPGYDIVINGQSKRSQGKGFRAYLNTLVSIAIQDCLYEYDLYVPRIFVVDSPILTLKEKEVYSENEFVSNPMKEGLFKYLVNHQENKQIVVIENDIPKIEYKNVNLIQFTKDEREGRYGLLTNFRD